MAIAGSLTVNILAKTTQFVKGIRDAKKRLNEFSGITRTADNMVRRFGAAIGGAVSIAAIQRFVSHTITATDQLAKAAQKLGTTTKALSFWRFAAEQAGINAQTLDMAFQRMVRRIGQAAQGFGEAKKTLEKFNIDARMLSQLDPAEQFRLIGEKINAITNQNEKLAAAMSLFDSEGVGLVNLFASNLGEAADHFERLGLEVDDVDAAKVEALGDAVSRLAQFAGAMGRGFVFDVSTDATVFIEKLTDLLVAIRQSNIFELSNLGPAAGGAGFARRIGRRFGFRTAEDIAEEERKRLEDFEFRIQFQREQRRKREEREKQEANERNKAIRRSNVIQLGAGRGAFQGEIPRTLGREAFQAGLRAEANRRQFLIEQRRAALAPGRNQFTPFARPGMTAAEAFIREQRFAIRSLGARGGALARQQFASPESARESREQFREAVRQRAEQIRNSRLTLDVQRQLLQTLGRETGQRIVFEPATFN